MLAALVAAVTLKTIVNVKSSPVCRMVQQLIVPFSFLEIQNGQDAQQIARLQGSLHKVSGSMFYSDWAAFYGSQVDQLTTTTAKRLYQMDQLLAQSWKETPRGRDPKADALRQLVQNIVDAQRTANNADIEASAPAVDTQGFAEIADASAAMAAPRALPAPPTAIQAVAAQQDQFSHVPAGQATPLPENDDLIPDSVPGTVSRGMLRKYSPDALTTYLGVQIGSFVPAAQAAARDCGTESRRVHP